MAKQIGLLNEFNEAYADKSYRDKATAEFRAIGHKISFFPFVMIENQIGTSGEVRNLQSILDALLTKVPRQAAIHAPRTPSPMMPA